jgi:large subunit ribosomal protein L18
MKQIVRKRQQRERRKRHVRKKVVGSAERPRLTVFRSHKNIYAQIIDDTVGRTLVAASSRESELIQQLANGGNRTAAKAVGAALAEKAVKAGIKKVVFDRNGYAYHGRVSELARAARDSGLEF